MSPVGISKNFLYIGLVSPDNREYHRFIKTFFSKLNYDGLLDR